MFHIFTVLLVEDADAFAKKVFSDDFHLPSTLSRALNVDISYEEWAALLFDVLDASLERYRAWVDDWRSGRTTDMFLVPVYPLLSRLNDNLVDVAYTQSEVGALRQEALSLINVTTNESAGNLLRTILAICDEAQKHNQAVYLLAP
ncbi:MAG TPA: hypothetical protein VJ810_12855 [Blastocatellia bacterium]|nr:hypothetical protein [Blastocatellia bacterium]